MIWKKTLLLAMLIIGAEAYGQIGVMAGPSIMRPFGAQRTFVGFHIGGEYSVDDASSYFGRITHYAGRQDSLEQVIDLVGLDATVPYGFTTYKTKTNYTVITGGARYYIGDGYETGLSAYGGTTLNLVFNTAKAVHEPFDESKYTFPATFSSKGNGFGFGLGVQGGVKYGIEGLATVYFDLGLDYLLAYNTQSLLVGNSRYIQQFLFHFNLGVRKDIGGW